jgi:hypothetical protein
MGQSGSPLQHFQLSAMGEDEWWILYTLSMQFYATLLISLPFVGIFGVKFVTVKPQSKIICSVPQKPLSIHSPFYSYMWSENIITGLQPYVSSGCLPIRCFSSFCGYVWVRADASGNKDKREPAVSISLRERHISQLEHCWIQFLKRIIHLQYNPKCIFFNYATGKIFFSVSS